MEFHFPKKLEYLKFYTTKTKILFKLSIRKYKQTLNKLGAIEILNNILKKLMIRKKTFMKPIVQKFYYLLNYFWNLKHPIDFLLIKKGLINKKTYRIQLRNNLLFYIRNNSNDQDVLEENVIWRQYKQGLKHQNPDDSIVIDIGAHIGIFSLLASQKAKKIFSFEPEPENFKLLKKNIKLNNVKNIVPINKAIAKETGKRELFLNKNNKGMHSFFIYNRKEADQKQIFVEAVTLEQELKRLKIKKIDLIKMDCEGAELEILNSLDKYIFKKIQKIIFEYHQNESFNQIEQHLINNEFTVNKIFEIRSGLGVALATNKLN